MGSRQEELLFVWEIGSTEKVSKIFSGVKYRSQTIKCI